MNNYPHFFMFYNNVKKEDYIVIYELSLMKDIICFYISEDKTVFIFYIIYNT